MDYAGQKLCETLFIWIIIAFGVVSWFVGYYKNDFFVAVNGWLAGVAIAVLLCVPDWPFYNRHPVKWLDAIPDRSTKSSSNSSSKNNSEGNKESSKGSASKSK